VEEVAVEPFAVEEEGVVVVSPAEAEVDTRDSTEAGTTSNEVAEADTAGAVPGGHATCSIRNLTPTTSRRLLESKPIDNTRTTMSLRPPIRASAKTRACRRC
jgi:hypothetical protein